MWSPKVAAAILAFVGATNAWQPPTYSGWNLVWTDTFAGNGGTSPNQNNWNIITGNLNVNAEQETYSSSTANVQLSGGSTLQLVPWRDSSKGTSTFGGWTSGRLESKYTFTPQAGKVTRLEAAIRFGSNAQANKQGIWPAFWMLGDSLRQPGGSWPNCGEIDIMETVDGQATGHGTLHCDVYPGGICNEGNGIGGPVNIANVNDWHAWRVEIDRTPSSWQSETLTWSLDGTNYFQITGSRIGNQNVWNNIAHSPLFFILNVAVGGNWPGNPNSATIDGYGSMMEVGYVAQYST
ncbi:glycoside hydrolase family 16 protein [Trichoderma sp. SZMC 28013]